MALRARQRLILAVATFFTAVYYLVVLNLHLSVTNSEDARERQLTFSADEVSAPGMDTRTVDNPDLSSVDYMACCGAGHRMSKLSEANYLSKLLGFSLRAFFGYCDQGRKQTEIFHYLFGPLEISLSANVTSQNLYARINNDVPGFRKLIRDGTTTCKEQCNAEKAQADVRFYDNLRGRFRWKAKVDEFRKQHFDNRLVIGIHIRAGNGETGDFSDRKRGIHDLETWLQNLANQITQKATGGWKAANDPIIFLATDTPSIVKRLQDKIDGIPVVVFEQPRPQAGAGVLFGEQGKVVRTGEQCLDGWSNTFIDMLLLSYSDVLVAARPSSFTQSLPMSLVYSGEKQIEEPFCEVDPTATEMRCYPNFMDWCCNGATEFSLQGIQRYDYLRMPTVGTMDSTSPDIQQTFKISPRPHEGCVPRPEGWKQVCLPYDWSEFVVRPRQAKGLQSPQRRRAGRPRRRGSRTH